MKYIISVDQGTTGSKAMLVGADGEVKACCCRELTQIYPKPGWVEHDPAEIWQNVLEVLRGVVAESNIDTADILALGITNQRETTVLWDRSTGRPVCNAIVWQCRRTSDYIDSLKDRGLEAMIKEKTGLVLDAYFSGTKIRWILDNVPGAGELAKGGRLAFGTVDSWLIWNLTGGKAHVTDASNASRTMLYNIHSLSWDRSLIELLEIPEGILPEVKGSAEAVGYVAKDILGREIPIAGVAGDQQAATFGQACLAEGDVKNTFGTGCFLLMNTGGVPVESVNNLLTTVAWKIGEKTTYALEGSVFVAGAAIQWLRDGLGLIRSAAETEGLACSVPDTGGVYVVPAFTGLGAPYWDMKATGTIAGITRGTGKAHIVRATLESLAYQVRDVLEAMVADLRRPLANLRIDGGASSNGFLAQFLADILGTPVERPRVIETTSMGAAFLAGLGVGLWGIQDIPHLRGIDKTYMPDMTPERRQKLLLGWQDAVGRTLTKGG